MSMFAMMVPLKIGHLVPWIWMYVGPDVFLPITSALAAIGGLLLMFWQKIVRLVARLFGKSTSEASKTGTSSSDKHQ